jgi:hypothetical protein
LICPAQTTESQLNLTLCSNPLLTVDPTIKQIDYLYKGIIPPNDKQFHGGTGNYLYLITGDKALGLDWTVYRVDTSVKCTIYY